MKALRRIILSISGLVLLVSCAWLWLMYTTSGARLVVERAASAAGAEVADVDGAIARGLELQGIRYAGDGIEVTVATLAATFDVGVLPTSVGRILTRLKKAELVDIQRGPHNVILSITPTFLGVLKWSITVFEYILQSSFNNLTIT